MIQDGKDDFSDENTDLEKTSVLASDTLNRRMEEATRTPPCVVMLVGPAATIGKQWLLTTSDLIIGRASTSNIHVDDKSVSKSHARLIHSAGQVTIVDLESTNKTFINDAPITPLVPRVLQNNDQIKVGNVIFKFLERGSLEALSVRQTFDRTQLDPLTQAYNRGALMNAGPEYFKKARKSRAALAVLVVDIDHFKQINDKYLHVTGDEVLRELSRLIRERLIRAEDFFARYGGEEFVVILPGSAPAKAEEIAERIRATVENHPFTTGRGILKVTVSVGVASLTEKTATWDEMFQQADKALYTSKNSGRNRVTINSP